MAPADGGGRAPAGWRDRYLLCLCAILGGYALLGKGFASLGVAPLFVGEAALAAGALAVFANGHYLALFSTAPSLLLAALFTWIAVRAAPGFEAFGVVALRDAVVAGYGVFALVVVSLLIERPERLRHVVRLYSGFAGVFGWVAAPLFYGASLFGGHLPSWPVSGISLISIRPGEMAVHVAGVAVFALAGLRRASGPWVAMVALAAIAFSPSRGATLAFAVPVGAALLLTGKLTRFAPHLLAGACLFAGAYALDLGIPLEGGRSMGPRQLAANFESLVGSTGTSNLDNTKAWRLAWWAAIENYTLHGPYFWTGKGFGESLAVIDGFLVGEETGGPPLRSPHNGHLTMLARAGVPGLALWAGTCLAWFGTVLGSFVVARRRGEPGWAGLFLWLACYLAAILVDASFDVALEGPMLGIWFWCLFGLGIGAAMIYRAMAAAAASWAVRARLAAAAARARTAPAL